MRVAEICPTCATYINATCIIYNGDYLTNLDVSPLDSLDDILGKINAAVPSLSGSGAPTSPPLYIGQVYIDTTNGEIYIGLSTTEWGIVGNYATTTSTSTTVA